jgi:hypothetical protein
MRVELAAQRREHRQLTTMPSDKLPILSQRDPVIKIAAASQAQFARGDCVEQEHGKCSILASMVVSRVPQIRHPCVEKAMLSHSLT